MPPRYTDPVRTNAETCEVELQLPAVRFALASADITRAGILARRADTSTVLVAWRDVVGIVARRLPDLLGAATFVDVVSVAGATVRVLPETRLGGDLVGGDARAVIAYVVARSPGAAIDRLTRGFCDGAAAAQLPDLALLAQHDARVG